MVESLPPEFLTRLSSFLSSSDAQTILEQLREPRPIAWRVNTLRGDPATARAVLSQAGVSWRCGWDATSGWAEADQRSWITSHQLIETGHLYVQGLASQLTAPILAPQPGEKVLDLAAAPGGKASHLAALMNNEGELCLVEPIRSRFFRMRSVLARLGVSNARLFMTDGRTVGHKVPEKFDRVLLDAPCTSESRMRADRPETFRTWNTRKIRECQRKQKGLIRSAFQALRSGGRLLYCTCSFAPEENESVVAHLLNEYSQSAELIPLDIDASGASPGLATYQGSAYPASMAHCLRLLPDQTRDGFFMALIGKS